VEPEKTLSDAKSSLQPYPKTNSNHNLRRGPRCQLVRSTDALTFVVVSATTLTPVICSLVTIVRFSIRIAISPDALDDLAADHLAARGSSGC